MYYNQLMEKKLPKEVIKFLKKIGSKGGKKSKRKLTKEESYKMIQARIKKYNQTPKKINNLEH